MNINNLLRYFLKPSNLFRRIKKYFHHKKIIEAYDYELLESEQSLKFSKFGLDYHKSKVVLDKLYSLNPELRVEMMSNHHHLFASLSQTYAFKNILEIGTHSGAGAVLLAKIFLGAVIDTIDLPDGHLYVESGSYGLKDDAKRSAFFHKRDQMLEKCKNVTFIQMDSTSLTFSEKKYDFIWVDANHEFPYVAVDIANAFRMLRSGGLIACDDVRMNNHTMQTLEQFFNAGLIEFELIHKRTVLPDNLDLAGKYIAIAKLKT